MVKKICFYVDESPYHPGKYVVKPRHENFHLTYTEGSYNIICARLMNLSYANYLRMCRDLLNAEVYGKGSLYPVAYFSDKLMAERLCKLLNARANLVLQERNNPQFWEMAREVKKAEHWRERLVKKHLKRSGQNE